MTRTVIHHFIETDDTLTEHNVGTSTASDGTRAAVLFADKRYGRDNYEMRNGYIVANDGRCLRVAPFPV